MMIKLHALFYSEESPDYELLGLEADLEKDTYFREVWINPDMIQSMWEGNLGTSVNTISDTWTVSETIEEVMEMMG